MEARKRNEPIYILAPVRFEFIFPRPILDLPIHFFICILANGLFINILNNKMTFKEA